MWLYKGKQLLPEEIPSDAYGFLYAIKTSDSKVYFGKKAITHRKKTYLSKRARKGTRKRVNVTRVDSGWQNYYGSCKPLLEYLKVNPLCTRVILGFYKTKQDLAYRETELLINENVLFRNDCWNGNVCGKYFRGKISPN